MRVAVIGSGPAAVGVLLGLERWGPPGMDISLFEIGETIDIPAAAQGPGRLDELYLRDLYRRLRAEHGYTFPPPKSRFGKTLTKIDVDGRPRFWASPYRGGLSSFWGGTMNPFTARELEGWPLSASDLAPYYQLVADTVGITGAADGATDALDGYFGRRFVTRPPLSTSPVVERLATLIAGADERPERDALPYRLIAGKSRLSVETRPEHTRACTYCGACMLGCGQRSLWSAADAIERLRESGFITRSFTGRVRSVADRRVVYQPRAPGHGMGAAGSRSEQRIGPFDRVFLAAGCIGTTEIVMRSLGLSRGLTLYDNTAIWFAVFYLGRKLANTRTTTDTAINARDYFSLCNLSMLAVPRERSAPTIPVSIYPSAEHIWRHITPERLWPLVRTPSRWARWRLLPARAYFGDDANPSFSVEFTDDRLAIRARHVPKIDARIDELMRCLRTELSGSAFFLSPIRPRAHGTAAHYAGTLPYGGSQVHVSGNGEITPGVHVADAAVFPSLPGIHLTFTIMANACRTARESL